jgi:catechol 2,3-dioxygenase-like lactoylglutathione lyase family enzyme
MQDASGWAGTMVDLLQWTIPPTQVSPAPARNRLGYTWLAVDVPDRAATIERAGEWPAPTITISDSVACWLLAPDGLPIELCETAGEQTHLAFVAINCRNLARTRTWYTDLLGFDARGDVHTRTLPAALAGSSAPVTAQAQRMALRGREHGFGIQLLQRTDAEALLPPLAMANAQGLFRLAVAVEDITDSYNQLRTLGADCALPPCWLQLGPEAPVEGVWALFFRDPDGTCVELIQTPQL